MCVCVCVRVCVCVCKHVHTVVPSGDQGTISKLDFHIMLGTRTPGIKLRSLDLATEAVTELSHLPVIIHFALSSF